MAIICSLLSVVAFVSVKMYPILLESVDLHGCLSIYGAGCILGFIFVLFVLDETTGKSLDQVVDHENTKTDHIHAARIGSI